MAILQTTFHSFKDTLHDFYLHPVKLYEKFSVKLSNLSYDAEFYQKIFQVFSAALLIKIANESQPTPLSRLSLVFSTVNLHDFYRLFKLPEMLLFPIRVQRIDENYLLSLLTSELRNHFQTGDDDPNIINFARTGLEKQLQEMEQKGDGYRTAKEFNEVLQKRFRALKIVHQNLKGKPFIYDFQSLDLKNLHVPIMTYSLLEKFEIFNWAIVHCGCLFLYLRSWELIDTAKWAEKLGGYQPLSWVKNQQLESWIRGIVCTAFFLKFFVAFQQLWSQKLTEQERQKALWQIVGTFFEILSNGAGYFNCIGMIKMNQITLQSLVIAAKGIGLFEIFRRPPRKFFEQPLKAQA